MKCGKVQDWMWDKGIWAENTATNHTKTIPKQNLKLAFQNKTKLTNQLTNQPTN